MRISDWSSDMCASELGLPTVRDILVELEKPGCDPRPEFKTATFSADVQQIADLKPGMVLEGTVTNVAASGAFVDIGEIGRAACGERSVAGSVVFGGRRYSTQKKQESIKESAQS